MGTEPGGMERWVEEHEDVRVDFRREILPKDDHPATRLRRWGLALSGGGIRSATFALGVLQGLACVRIGAEAPTRASKQPLIKYFDYLSTVSGGGYTGSFFCSLFVPGRVRPPRDTAADSRSLLDRLRSRVRSAPRQMPPSANDSIEAANLAYDVLRYEPPGRYRSADKFEGAEPGRFPLAWLRENGRYLLPTGSGDAFYAAAITLRNWISLHYVVGTLLLVVLATVAALRSALCMLSPDYANLERSLLVAAIGQKAFLLPPVWWSPVLWLPVLCAVPMVAIGLSFWIAHLWPWQQPGDKVWIVTPAGLATIASALALLVLGRATPGSEGWRDIALGARSLAYIAFAAAVLHAVTTLAGRTVAEQRVATTRYLSSTLMIALGLLFLGVIDTLGQTLYRAMFGWEAFGKSLSSAGIVTAIGGLVVAIRKGTKWLLPKDGKAAKIAPEQLAWVGGTALLLAVVLLWQGIVHVVQWHLGEPAADAIGSHDRYYVLVALLVVSVALAWLTGKFPSFINLSSLQSFYGSRLTRAYLGASNGERFASDSGRRFASVAEPHPRDDLTCDDYYGDGGTVRAPIHIINVTMNQTSDPAEQLVQRDRKGKPLAVSAGGFFIDGEPYPFGKAPLWREIRRPLTVGQWIGTSGAAISTGLGRATSPGVSMALGLANVRLGTWWESGVGRSLPRTRPASYFEMLFTSQAYLLCELTARYHGLRRPWQYLTDGGHFENTAIYELLRPERQVALTVACDAGADPRYEFGDLANLIRLARIDFGAEVTVDRAIARAPGLQEVFGTPEEFRRRESYPDKCAVLLRVSYSPRKECAQAGVDRLVILLKPSLVAAAEADVQEYARTHEHFPQEPTADQFFDEAQWESYRKIGRTIALRVFGDEGVGPQLWKYLQQAYPAIVSVDPAAATAPAGAIQRPTA
jgi:hypothetical protein